jgi:hypothetical protein
MTRLILMTLTICFGMLSAMEPARAGRDAGGGENTCQVRCSSNWTTCQLVCDNNCKADPLGPWCDLPGSDSDCTLDCSTDFKNCVNEC